MQETCSQTSAHDHFHAPYPCRLSLSCLLLWMPPAQQLLAAFGIGVTSMVACREGSPFYEPEMSRVYYGCGWVIVLCILALRFQDLQMFELRAVEVDGDIISAALIGTNLGVLLLIFISADYAGRVLSEGRLVKLIDELILAEGEDKVAFNKMWSTLMEKANLTDEAVREKLQGLVDLANPTVSQANRITTSDSLYKLSLKHYKLVKKALKKFLEGFDAEFHGGRVKRALEIEYEASDEDSGYGGDVRRVVDPITGMVAVFSNLTDFMKFVGALTDGRRDKSGKRPPRVHFVRNNIMVPLDTGFRELALNLTVPGTDGLVVELTVQFETMRELEPMALRVRLGSCGQCARLARNATDPLFASRRLPNPSPLPHPSLSFSTRSKV